MSGSIPPGGAVSRPDIHTQSAMGNLPSHGTHNRPMVDEETLELLSHEMSFSALYMHEIHRQRINNPYYENLEDIHARSLWQSAESHQPQEPLPTVPPSGRLPTQQEEDEDEEEEVDTGAEQCPLLMKNETMSDKR